MIERNISKGHANPKILFAIGSLGLGGAEKQMALLIKHLDRLNFDCHLFALEPSGPINYCLSDIDIKICDGGYNSEKSFNKKLLLLLRAQYRLFRAINKIKPDIIHCYLPLTNFMGSFAGRCLRVPLIITSKRALGYHQDRNKGWRLFDIASFRLSHCVTVNSKAVGEDTIRRDRGNGFKTKLIYNGVELKNFISDKNSKRKIRKELKIGLDRKVILNVANLIPYKGHIELINAAALVTRIYPSTIFLLVGEDHGIKKKLEELTKKLDITENVVFMDQRNDIPKLMAASDIFVLPSHEEGFSNVILESMTAGLPTVATNVGGNPEAIIEGKTGLLVPPKNSKELALKIVYLLRDSTKAKKLGEAARRRVIENFTEIKMVEEHIRLYQKFLSPKIC